MDSLRIALVSSPFIECPPRTYGGLERVVFDLACGLTELGHKVVLFAPRMSQVPPNGFLVETNEPILKYGTDWGKVDWFEMEKKAYKVYKDKLKDFDLAHSHTWFGFEYLAKIDNPNLKVCHTHHGGLNWKSKPPGIDKLNLVAISDWMAKTYEGQGFTSRRCYNGINLDAYPFKKQKGERLIYVGRFTSFKGTHIAIEVAKKLGMGLDLVGGAYEEPYFSQKIKPYCDDKQIVLHPEASHDVKVKLLQDAKALLFPSQMSEPFGLVAVEAMASGTPVVALRDGAIPEVVEDGVTGYICGSIDEMIEAVKKIDRIKPEACRERTVKYFGRKTMASNYLKLYDEVLQGSEW